MLILLYFYVSAGLLLVTEYFNTVVLLLLLQYFTLTVCESLHQYKVINGWSKTSKCLWIQFSKDRANTRCFRKHFLINDVCSFPVSRAAYPTRCISRIAISRHRMLLSAVATVCMLIKQKHLFWRTELHNQSPNRRIIIILLKCNCSVSFVFTTDALEHQNKCKVFIVKLFKVS